ncbi:MAG: anthranilate phosphoribosyltransferase [Candidatus Koribacter versatilis]|uniref:Anthranilate phosphoribosyltransferase n=1 Tax=Candidatus Korobacter versatilis TaxID=658062 RepID=A0A932EQD7_9BACT|nr:anthranilate phosphoribosyltransferase [Candidatus Koribacter versatilis]
MITESIHLVASHQQSLTRDQARAVMLEILSGNATDAQIAALLVALHMKGETVDEIVGFAEAIRTKAIPVPGNSALDVSDTERDALVDTCGTGGDTSGTFNISTVTAFVIAGAGVRVAKHGNRSVTSQCGSADVVEQLGVDIMLTPDRLAACLNEVGIAFFYAPNIHATMKHVQVARKELRLRTIFNLLGPLTNPAHASAQVVGVYAEWLVEKLGEALRRLGLKRGFVVHGMDGLDEITISRETKVAELRNGRLKTYYLQPEEVGVARAALTEITGGDARQNAKIIREVLAGKKSARRDVVLMNAAAALVAAGKAETIKEGMPLATESIDSGKAANKLDALVKFTTAKKK